MPTPFDRRVNDNPSTYFVQDRKNKKEVARLMVQDQIVTKGMGGVLLEQSDPTVFRHVLDVGCGIGGWMIEAANAYPTMSFVGIDISQRMIEHARAQAHQVSGQVEFRVMDALRPLEFPDASFDLINLRFGVSYLRTWDWPKFLTELLRVTSPGGVIRITDTEVVHQSNSPALTQLCKMVVCALYRAGHLFEQKDIGLTPHLARLLDQYGCDQVQEKAYAMEYRAGTVQGEAYYEDMMLAFQTSHPFIQKWGCGSLDYDALCRQALEEMKQPEFHVTWHMLTAWGNKPGSRS